MMAWDPAKYTVGWICAIRTQAVAAKLFLDETYGRPESCSATDGNSYELGRIGDHYVVIASLPEGEYGLVNAAVVARDMLHTFPKVRIGLLVGVAGGAPSDQHDVRLGDIVVNSGTTLQYDYGKKIQDRPFSITGHSNRPPSVLLTAVSMLRSDYAIMAAKGQNPLDVAVEEILQRNLGILATHSRPDETTDRLFRSDVVHGDSNRTCDEAGCSSNVYNLSRRKERKQARNRTLVHYGTIASADRLMKDAMIGDKMVESHNVLCFEMEAAGLVNHFPCLVIRGICDYSDTHKNKEWEGFASLVAAAYAKDVLGKIAPTAVEEERPLADISKIMKEQTRVTGEIKKNTDVIRSRQGMLHVKEWLDPADPSTNYNDARKVRYRGTGAWILKSCPFREWEAGDHRHLWLHGMQGCGKTVLAYTIMEHVAERTDSNGVTVRYFFDCRDPQKQTFDSMVRGLLYQLYCLGTETEFNNIYNSLDDKMKRGRPATSFLVDSLNDTLKTNMNVNIILDALDECSTRQELIDWLIALVKDAALGHVKLVTTSRSEAELKQTMRDIVGEEGCVALSSREIKADIRTYVEGSLKQRPGFRRWAKRPDGLRRISAEVISKADGMFRFAACLLESLEKCVDIQSIDGALESIPQDLADIYEGIFQRLPREGNLRDRIIRLLQFLIYPNEQLSLEEAVDIVAVQDHGFKRSYRMPHSEDLKVHCSSFITVSNGRGPNGEAVKILRVAHSSVRDYLLTRQAQLFTNQESYKVIALTCLAYLKSIEGGAEPEAIKRDYYLAEYAALYWMKYARLSEDSDEVVAAAANFLGDRRRLKIWASLYDKPGAEVKGTALYYSCQNNLPRLSQRLIRDRPEDLNAHAQGDHGYGYPLQAAAREGHIEIVQLLLDSEADVDNVGGAYGTALQAACRWHRKDVVKLLLSHKANPNIQAGCYWNALHAAITGPRPFTLLPGEEQTVAQSEGSKASPDMDVEIVNLLLEHGADPNSDGLYGSALGTALHNNRPDLADLLLDRDANVDLTYIYYADADGTQRLDECTPLYLAVMRGMEYMVQRLLQEGANMDAFSRDTQNNAWETPLQAAERHGYRKITALLLEAISTRRPNSASEAAVQNLTNSPDLEDFPYRLEPRLVLGSPYVESAIMASAQSSGYTCHTSQRSSSLSSKTEAPTPDSPWRSSMLAFDISTEQSMVSPPYTTHLSGYAPNAPGETEYYDAATAEIQPTSQSSTASPPYTDFQLSQTAPPAIQPFQAPPESNYAVQNMSSFEVCFSQGAQIGALEPPHGQTILQRSKSTGHAEEMGSQELQAWVESLWGASEKYEPLQTLPVGAVETPRNQDYQRQQVRDEAPISQTQTSNSPSNLASSSLQPELWFNSSQSSQNAQGHQDNSQFPILPSQQAANQSQSYQPAQIAQAQQSQSLAPGASQAQQASISPQNYQNSQGYQFQVHTQNFQSQQAVNPGQSYQPSPASKPTPPYQTQQAQSFSYGHQAQPDQGQLQTSSQMQRAKSQPNYYTGQQQTVAQTLQAQQAIPAYSSTAQLQQQTTNQGASSAASTQTGQAGAGISSWANGGWQHRTQHQQLQQLQPPQPQARLPQEQQLSPEQQEERQQLQKLLQHLQDQYKQIYRQALQINQQQLNVHSQYQLQWQQQQQQQDLHPQIQQEAQQKLLFIQQRQKQLQHQQLKLEEQQQLNLQQQKQLKLQCDQLQQGQQQQQQQPTSQWPTQAHQSQPQATGTSQTPAQTAHYGAYLTSHGALTGTKKASAGSAAYQTDTTPYQSAQAPTQQGQGYNFQQAQQQQHNPSGPSANSQSNSISQTQQHSYSQVRSSGQAGPSTGYQHLQAGQATQAQFTNWNTQPTTQQTQAYTQPAQYAALSAGNNGQHITTGYQYPAAQAQYPTSQPASYQPYQAPTQQPPFQQGMSNGPQLPSTKTLQWQQPGYQQQSTWNANNTGWQQQQQ